MLKFNEFAFCFLSSDVNDVVRQENVLTKLTNKYQIERWYRHDRNSGRYVSFSQMINDAIDDTESEFMIFCNPKTHFNEEDVEFIIEKLSNGYCFASVVSFGFFGFSKELIRHIGMLDERFIGGEWEDNDFAVRLNYFGKASWWDYEYGKYENNWSKSGNLKHITSSIFNQKYKVIDNQILINKQFFIHKKISKRYRKFNNEIYNSWLDRTYNSGNCEISKYLTQYDVQVNDENKKEVVSEFNLLLNRNNNNYKVSLISDVNIKLYITVLSDLNDGRKLLWLENIDSNTWKTFQIFYDKSVEIRIFVDDNQIYNNIINNNNEINIDFKLPVFITD